MLAQIAPLALAVAGIIGAVWGGLRFNREDAKSAVDLMRGLNDELVEALDRARVEIAELKAENKKLRRLIVKLRATIERCRDKCRALGGVFDEPDEPDV